MVNSLVPAAVPVPTVVRVPSVVPVAPVVPPERSRSDLSDLLRSLLTSSPWSSAWQVEDDDPWVRARPVGVALPEQGWKLHVSATVASVPDVLSACTPVLLRHQCAFKVARGSHQVWQLGGGSGDRASLGKVITAYPADDAQSVHLAAELDRATAGLAGPRVLSDCPYRPGSVVHYRFGAYGGRPAVDLDGRVTPALRDPEGRSCPDVREPRFNPPPWARNPFAVRAAGAAGAPPPGHPTPLLHGRYQVRGAFRHAARGGVFRAWDEAGLRSVVIKQARHDVLADESGRDARDRVRNEAALLDVLAPTGDVPERLDLFEAEGDLFLVEQDLGGRSLRAWVEEPDAVTDGARRPLHESLTMLVGVARLVDRVHRAGLVLLDLSPNNLIVDDDGRIRLVDLELAGTPAEVATRRGGGTPGYFAPEQLTPGAGCPASDAYALGKLVMFVLTGESPLLLPRESLDEWLDVAPRRRCAPEPVWRLVAELCDADPSRRLELRHAAARLGAVRAGPHRPLTRQSEIRLVLDDDAPLSDETLDAEIATLLDRLLSDLARSGPPGLPSQAGRQTLPTNVQHGSAGVLGVLCQARRLGAGATLDEPIERLARWTADHQPPRTPTTPVGLVFGAAGPCWSLVDAANAGVADDERAARLNTLASDAVDEALRLPRDLGLHDVTHGLAGLGLTMLRLASWRPDARLVAGALEIADRLVEEVQRDQDGPFWRPPRHLPSQFAGTRMTGYAHGLAGVTTFLQAMQAAAPSSHTGALIDESVHALVRLGVETQGCLRWRSEPRSPATPGVTWCNGTAGVLVPLVTAAKTAPELVPVVERAASALIVDGRRWGIAYCHGLAGFVDALVDVAGLTGDELWTRRARTLAARAVRRRVTDPPPSWADPLHREDGTDFGIGYPGLLSVLLRLRRGGARLWSVQPPDLAPEHRPVPTRPQERG